VSMWNRGGMMEATATAGWPMCEYVKPLARLERVRRFPT